MKNNKEIIYRKIDITKSLTGVCFNNYELEYQLNAYNRSLSALRYVDEKLKLGLSLPEPNEAYVDLPYVYEQIVNRSEPDIKQRIEDIYYAYLYGSVY